MQDLFRRYLNDQCSPEEVSRFLSYFRNRLNEPELRELIRESLDDNDIDDGGNRGYPGHDHNFAQIRREMIMGIDNAAYSDRRNIARVGIAAAVVVGGLSICSSFTKTTNKKDTAKVSLPEHLSARSLQAHR
ncbi:hypothetical protein ACX0G7_16090 [Flavitalea antarctica]